MQVYPNPTNGNITFQINAPSNTENYELTIYNTSLQPIKYEKVMGSKSLSINNDKLSSGSYFFSLQTTNKIIQTGKFIIIK